MPTVPVPEGLEFELLQALGQQLDAEASEALRDADAAPESPSETSSFTPAGGVDAVTTNPFGDEELPTVVHSLSRSAADDALPLVLKPDQISPTFRPAVEPPGRDASPCSEVDDGDLLQSEQPPPVPRTRSRRRRAYTLLFGLIAGASALSLGFVYPDSVDALRLKLFDRFATATATPVAKPPPTAAAGLPSSLLGEAMVEHEAPRAPTPEPAPGIPWQDGSETTPQGCTPAPGHAGPPTTRDAVKAHRARTLGQQALMQGDLTSALGALCDAASLTPHDPALALDIARALLIARAPRESEPWARHALQLAPENRRAREMLGDVLAWQGQVDAAKAEWFKVHDITRPNASVEAALERAALEEAHVAMQRKNHPRAERLLRRALVFGDSNPATVTWVARALLAQGRPASAKLWIEHALALEPTSERRELADIIARQL